VFTELFRDEMRNKLEIAGFSSEVVEGFLKYMYTRQLKNESIAIELYEIAAEYKVKKMEDEVERIILRNINEFNAIDVFSVGHLHNSDRMKERHSR
jgi:BTB/POZ domain